MGKTVGRKAPLTVCCVHCSHNLFTWTSEKSFKSHVMIFLTATPNLRHDCVFPQVAPATDCQLIANNFEIPHSSAVYRLLTTACVTTVALSVSETGDLYTLRQGVIFLPTLIVFLPFVSYFLPFSLFPTVPVEISKDETRCCVGSPALYSYLHLNYVCRTLYVTMSQSKM